MIMLLLYTLTNFDHALLSILLFELSITEWENTHCDMNNYICGQNLTFEFLIFFLYFLVLL